MIIINSDKPYSCHSCIFCEDYACHAPGVADCSTTECPLIEIPMCKDCKWHYADKDILEEDILRCTCGPCEGHIVDPYFYCAFGEREKDD